MDASESEYQNNKPQELAAFELIKPFPSSSGFSSTLAKALTSAKREDSKLFQVGSALEENRQGFEVLIKDLFQGPATLRNLSSRLAIGPDEEISDEEIVNLMGKQVLEAFRYAQKRLVGLCRRTTREPSFCHSADIALRSLDLGYYPYILKLSLLHDIVEDLSSSLMEVSLYLQDIASKFGSEVALDVRILTNRYNIIINTLKRRVPTTLPFERESLNIFRQEADKLWHELPEPYHKEFEFEFHQFMDYYLNDVDISGGARISKLDKNFTLATELALQVYKIYLDEMNDYSRVRSSREYGGFYEAVLVVKFLDLIDNLRTSEVNNWMALERILIKTEMVLDRSFYLHDYIRNNGFTNSTFILLYDFLKYNLIEQLNERKRALGFLADTRFAFLAEYLVKQISRLQDKYKVSLSPIRELAHLRDEIRNINMAV